MARNSDGIIGMITPGQKTSVDEVKKINKGRKVFPGSEGRKKPTSEVAGSGESDNQTPSKRNEQGVEPVESELKSGTLLLLDSKVVDSWKHKDRKLPEIEDDPKFHRLVERIKARNGNLQPIKVRQKKGEPGRFEEIFGFKRLQACKRLGLPVLAVYEDLDDAEAFLQMFDENEGKSPVSAWSRALSWSMSLQEGLVSSEEDLASEVGLELKTVRAYLRVARIMDPDLDRSVKLHKLGIQALFEVRSGLLELENDPAKRQEYIDRIVEKADVISSGKATPTLFQNILKSVKGTAKAAGREKLVASADGAKLFSVKQQKQGYSLKMHFAGTKEITPQELETVLKEYLIKKGVEFGDADDSGD